MRPGTLESSKELVRESEMREEDWEDIRFAFQFQRNDDFTVDGPPLAVESFRHALRLMGWWMPHTYSMEDLEAVIRTFPAGIPFESFVKLVWPRECRAADSEGIEACCMVLRALARCDTAGSGCLPAGVVQPALEEVWGELDAHELTDILNVAGPQDVQEAMVDYEQAVDAMLKTCTQPLPRRMLKSLHTEELVMLNLLDSKWVGTRLSGEEALLVESQQDAGALRSGIANHIGVLPSQIQIFAEHQLLGDDRALADFSFLTVQIRRPLENGHSQLQDILDVLMPIMDEDEARSLLVDMGAVTDDGQVDVGCLRQALEAMTELRSISDGVRVGPALLLT
eukprot:TRINITY_DN13810_c0_g1_i1.p1 TRINITY_DN13810_c0_g1~~TRINITY_DN13810_c0_g1_i1.p1  ORF type:complete len:339 (-),score=59.53 TRINITY_DN13810_c0_g1_i1:140-1156(-)